MEYAKTKSDKVAIEDGTYVPKQKRSLLRDVKIIQAAQRKTGVDPSSTLHVTNIPEDGLSLMTPLFKQ